jgi:hypothetical protein
MITTVTKRLRITRGQTLSFTEICRDADTNQPVDLTDMLVHWVMRADMKVAPTVRLTSVDDPLPDGWRLGVEILPQTGSTIGKYRVTVIPEDTEDLVALGASDPWLHESWIEWIETEDEPAGRQPHITTSILDLDPQVLDVPA